jgi:hypothetical protein
LITGFTFYTSLAQEAAGTVFTSRLLLKNIKIGGCQGEDIRRDMVQWSAPFVSGVNTASQAILPTSPTHSGLLSC